MTRQVEDAQLRVYDVGNTGSSADPNAADHVIPDDYSAANIRSIEVEERTKEERDVITARVSDPQQELLGEFTSPGQRIVFSADFGAGFERIWTGLLLNDTLTLETGDRIEWALDCDDYVYGILASRTVSNGFSDTQAAGANDAVLNTIIGNNANELSTAGIDTFGQLLDITFDSSNLLEAVHEIERRTGAMAGGDDKQLEFTDVRAADPSVTVTGSDIRLPLEAETTGDALVNSVRVNAGRGSAEGPKQGSQSSTEIIGDANTDPPERKTADIGTFPKAEVLYVDVYTDTVSGSGDKMVLRIQETQDDGTGAIAPDDRSRDLGRATVDSGSLTAGGFTRFQASASVSIGDALTLIVEVLGEDGGQKVGVDSNSDLTYITYYPIPLDVQQSDQSSIDEHRRREAAITRRDTPSQEAAEEAALAELNRRTPPEKTLAFEADSVAMHDLDPTQVVESKLTSINRGGRYAVETVRHEYREHQLFTDVTLHSVNSL